jgi:hypothetical protein
MIEGTSKGDDILLVYSVMEFEDEINYVWKNVPESRYRCMNGES